MHPVVNHIIQLQELTLIRDEQKVAGNGGHLEQLDQSIKTMTAQLPADIRTLYERLHRKDHIVIVGVSEGGCASCGMRLPISLIQAVRLGQEVKTCPNCARMLFAPDTLPRRVTRPERRTTRLGRTKAGVQRFSAESLMVPRLESAQMDGVIEELATRMAEEGFVDDAAKLVEKAQRREAVLSTAVGHGLAFPHVRGVEGGGLTFALGISQKGFQAGGADGKLTRMAFFIVIPTAASAFYLKLLAGLSEAFSDAENRKAVMAEKDPAGVWKALCKATRSTVK